MLAALGSGVWIGFALLGTGVIALEWYRDMPIARVLAQDLWARLNADELVTLPLVSGKPLSDKEVMALPEIERKQLDAHFRPFKMQLDQRELAALEAAAATRQGRRTAPEAHS